MGVGYNVQGGEAVKMREVKKGDWIVNSKIPEAEPWWVVQKYTGMITVRRGPKTGEVVAITTRQLHDFSAARVAK